MFDTAVANRVLGIAVFNFMIGVVVNIIIACVSHRN